MRRRIVAFVLASWLAAACGPSAGPSPSAVIVTSTTSAFVVATPGAPPPTDTPTIMPQTSTAQSTPYDLLRLTNHPARDETPAWSWDGARITFSSDRTGVYEIYAVDNDGSDLVQLTEDPSIGFKEDPTWSASGIIAFSALFDVSRVFAFNVKLAEEKPFDLSEPTNEGYPEPLSNWYVDAYSPSWSPDGEKIALIMLDSNLVRQAFTINPASGKSTQLTNSSRPVHKPSWSPDGRWIAFSSETEGNEEVYLIGADGRNLTRLTHDPAYDSRPSWSPDSRFIVFSSDRGGSYGLHLMQLDGTYISRLDTGPGEAFDPAWSPDGRYIAFVSDRDGNAEIYRIDAPVLEP